MPRPLFFYIYVLNTMAFILFGMDKALSKRKDARRIPEKTLLWLARLGGGTGGCLGMLLFRHKTKHKQFKVLVPLWAVIWIAVVVVYVYKKDYIYGLLENISL